MRRKKSSLTTTIIIILVIIVGGIFAYIYIEDKKLENNQVEEKETKTQKKEVKEEELAIDSEEVKEALDNINHISAIDIYNDYKIDGIDKYRLVLTAINGLNEDQITWCISSARQITATITIDDLNNALNKYVVNQKLTIDDIKNNKGESGLTVGKYGYDMYAITIDEDNDIHVIGSCDGRGPGISKETIKTNIVKAVKKEDELYIYTKVAYGNLNSTANELSYDYYMEFQKTNFVETVVYNGDLTWDKYNTYKQIYKKIGDKYYFISSKKDS